MKRPGCAAPDRIANFERARTLITDANPPAPLRRALKTLAGKIVVAG